MPSILIVSAFFPPSRRIGSRRPARMAMHLARMGWDVTVLTTDEWRWGRPVDMPDEPAPPGVRVLRTGVWMPIDALRRAGVVLAGRFRGGRSGSSPRAVSGDSVLATVRPGAGPGEPAVEAPPGEPAPGEAVPSGSPVSSLRRWYAQTLAAAEFPDKYAGWLPYALLAARGAQFDVVLATIPAYTPAVIARILSVRTGARLVLDYRDPWTEAPRRDFGEGWHEGLRERHRRLEDGCLARASLAVGVSPGICRFLEARAHCPVLLAPNSYDIDEPAGLRRDGAAGQTAVARAGVHGAQEASLASSPPSSPSSPSSSGPARLLYAGTLAYGRSLDPIFAAIARLAPEAGPDRLRFVYAGPDSARVRRDARARGVERYLEDLRSIEASAARGLVHDAAAVVVAVSEGYEYQYPGKIFDVVATGRPVLLIAPAGADATELVRGHHLGWSHEPDDVDGIAGSIRRAMAGANVRPEGLEIFETRHVMGALDAALRRLA